MIIHSQALDKRFEYCVQYTIHLMGCGLSGDTSVSIYVTSSRAEKSRNGNSRDPRRALTAIVSQRFPRASDDGELRSTTRRS